MNATTEYQIVFDGRFMLLWDDEENGVDGCMVYRGLAASAERKIDEWSAKYALDAERAKRELRSYLKQL